MVCSWSNRAKAGVPGLSPGCAKCCWTHLQGSTSQWHRRRPKHCGPSEPHYFKLTDICVFLHTVMLDFPSHNSEKQRWSATKQWRRTTVEVTSHVRMFPSGVVFHVSSASAPVGGVPCTWLKQRTQGNSGPSKRPQRQIPFWNCLHSFERTFVGPVQGEND